MSISLHPDQHEESTSSRSAPPGFSTNDFKSRSTQLLDLLEKITEKYQNEPEVVEQHSKQTDLLISVAQYILLPVTISKEYRHSFLRQVIKVGNDLLNEDRANLEMLPSSPSSESDTAKSENEQHIALIARSNLAHMTTNEVDKPVSIESKYLTSSDRLTDDSATNETEKMNITNQDQLNSSPSENSNSSRPNDKSDDLSLDDLLKCYCDSKTNTETLHNQLKNSLSLGDAEHAVGRAEQPSDSVRLPITTLNGGESDELSLDDLMMEYSADDNKYSSAQISSTLTSDNKNENTTTYQIPINVENSGTMNETNAETVSKTQTPLDQSSLEREFSPDYSRKTRTDILPLSLDSILVSARLSSQDAADDADCIWKDDISVFGKIFCAKNANDEPKLVQRVSTCLLYRQLYERLTIMIDQLPKTYTPPLINSTPRGSNRRPYSRINTPGRSMHTNTGPEPTSQIHTVQRDMSNESSNSHTPYRGTRANPIRYQHVPQTFTHANLNHRQNPQFTYETESAAQPMRSNNPRYNRNQRQNNYSHDSQRQPTQSYSYNEHEQHYYASNTNPSMNNQSRSHTRNVSNNYERRPHPTQSGRRNGRHT